MESALQRLIADRLEALNLKPVEAARRGGLGRDYLRDALEGRKVSIRSDMMAKLAKALKVDASLIQQAIDIDRGMVPARPEPGHPSVAATTAGELTPVQVQVIEMVLKADPQAARRILSIARAVLESPDTL